jgi:hypothetical protein
MPLIKLLLSALKYRQVYILMMFAFRVSVVSKEEADLGSNSGTCHSLVMLSKSCNFAKPQSLYL